MNTLIGAGALVSGGGLLLLVACAYPRYRAFKKWEYDRNGTSVCQSRRYDIRADIRFFTVFLAGGVAMIVAGLLADTFAVYGYLIVSLLAFAAVSILGYWISVQIDRELKRRISAFTV